MKKIMFIFAFTLLVAPQGGAQDIPEFESREQAIEVLRNSDFLEILRYPGKHGKREPVKAE